MMRKIVEKRKSLREFSEKKITVSDRDTLLELVKVMPSVSNDGLSYEFYEDGKSFSSKLNGLAGYNGIMIEAPQYLLITVKDGKNHLKSAGYASEWIALKLAEMEIGTCQISIEGNEDKISEKLELEVGQSPACFLALGFAVKPSFLASIFSSSKEKTGRQSVELTHDMSSERKSVQNFVYSERFGNELDMENLEDLPYIEAFYYMSLAPSILNRQPWKFVISGDEILLLIDRGDDKISESSSYIEAGIAMLYFDIAMRAEGYSGKWCTEEAEAGIEIPENYFLAGRYSSN